MKFTRTPLEDAWVIHLEPHEDERGSFSRAFCARELGEIGLDTHVVQANLSVNRRAGVLHGLHMQSASHAETKMVRCVVGRVFDVIVDLREGSPTKFQWFGIELSASNGLMLYVPKGFAHGYQALTDGATVFYLTTEFYEPEAEGGVRWNDPSIGIDWPLEDPIVSERDSRLPFVSELSWRIRNPTRRGK